MTQQSSADGHDAKRHKHKHKCGDLLCKHRKHKKRRKHKKHHHREGTSVPVALQENGEEQVDRPAHTIALAPSTIAAGAPSGKTKKVVAAKKTKIEKETETSDVFNVTIKEEALTEEELASSITEESSGSCYVSQVL